MAYQIAIDARAIAALWEAEGNEAAHALFLKLSKELLHWEAVVLREAACKLHANNQGVNL